ncbi:MAG: hypothetical protein ACHQF4_00685 [Sphingobacteriales bacterium]
MIKRLGTLWMALYFLVGGMVLPLGDFSLMRDIPHMYHNYKKIVSDDDAGIIDFIGDYLLHGKEIFDNNTHDKPQTATTNVQFPHPVNPLIVVLFHTHFHTLNLPQLLQKHKAYFKTVAVIGFKKSLFRPPLA